MIGGIINKTIKVNSFTKKKERKITHKNNTAVAVFRGEVSSVHSDTLNNCVVIIDSALPIVMVIQYNINFVFFSFVHLMSGRRPDQALYKPVSLSDLFLK